MLMPRRYGLLMMLFVLVLGGAGCNRYGGRGGDSYELSAGYWTLDIETAEASYSGGDTVNLLADTGLSDEDDTYFAQFMYSKGMDLYGLGFGTSSSSGEAALSADLTFGGTTFLNGSTVHSSFDMNEYQLIIASRMPEPQALTTYSFVVEYLDFNVTMYDTGGPATASFDDSATMLLLGIAYEWMAGAGTVYFVDAKYMDLDIVRIGHTGGDYLDVYGGVKWSMGGNKSHLVVGYRYTDMDLDIEGNTLRFSFSGPTVGFSARF